MKALAATGSPMAPSSMRRRQVLVEREPERLLAVDRLARLERAAADVGVGRGDREVHHDVELRVREQRVHVRRVGDRVLLRELSRSLGHQIRAGGELQEGQGGELGRVGTGDDPAAHDADPGQLAHARGRASPAATR
jgi:hypothetical protein